MFSGANAFNQPIGAWNTGAVTNMEYMFWRTAVFNQPIGTWNTGAVTNMNAMFYQAAAFNQNITGWNVAAVITKPPTDFSTSSALTARNSPVWFPWTFTYFSTPLSGTMIPTQQLLSDDLTGQSSGWGTVAINPYIQADFGSVKTISSIILGPITDNGWSWSYLNGAALEYNIEGIWHLLFNINQTNTSLPTITYSTNISTRYIRIRMQTPPFVPASLGVATFHFTFA